MTENTWQYRDDAGPGYWHHTTFENGYGASVVSHERSYGGKDGLFEVAVTHVDRLCYSSSVTNDVLGWLTHERVAETLKSIKQLSPNELCAHTSPPYEWNES